MKQGIEQLIGCTINKIIGQKGDEIIEFHTDKGNFKMYHRQDCCEDVRLYDVDGDLQDLIGSVVLSATEDANTDDKMGAKITESFTWTFYTIRTLAASVTFRWLGESNGYYSEDVEFKKI